MNFIEHRPNPHVGLLSLLTSDPMPMKTSNANYGNKKRGESNPSFQQTPSFTT